MVVRKSFVASVFVRDFLKRKPREGVCGGLQSQLSSAPARSDFPERGESLLSHLGHVSDPVLLSISSLLTGWVVSGRSRSLLFICPSGVVTRHFRGSNVCVTLLPRPQHVPPKQRQKEPPPGRPFRHSDRCTEDAVFGRRGNILAGFSSPFPRSKTVICFANP